MRFPYNIAIIGTVEDWPTLQLWLASLGWPNEVGVALTADGQTETHRAIHPRADDAIVAIATGQVTPEVEGVDHADIQALVGRLLVRVEAYDANALLPLMAEHGMAFMPQNNLT